MRPDGVLVLVDKEGEIVWVAPGAPSPGAFGLLRDDGEFVVLSEDETVELFTTGTDGNAVEPLEVSDEGRAVLRLRGGPPIWESGRIAPVVHGRAPDGSHRLGQGHVLNDGDLVASPSAAFTLKISAGSLLLYQGDSRVQILAETEHEAALVMQLDGNLVLYQAPREPHGAAAFATGTKGSGADALVLHDDGRLLLTGPRGVVCAVAAPPSFLGEACPLH